MRRPRKWGLRALVMIPAAHELQYAPASAARSQFLHVGFAVTRPSRESLEFVDNPSALSFAMADCHQLQGSHTSAFPWEGSVCLQRTPPMIRAFEYATGD